jgi:hypothetical protein
MRLTSEELDLVMSYLYREQDQLQPQLLEKMELGIWVPRPQFLLGNDDYDSPILVIGRFGQYVTRRLLEETRSNNALRPLDEIFPGRYRLLLIRTQSWTIVVDCNGDILTEHCEEDVDKIREATEKVRQRCSSLRASTPSFLDPRSRFG